MIPRQFEYVVPADVNEAVKALASGDAKILAGGTKLIRDLKKKVAEPALLVDLKRISSLSYIDIREQDKVVSIGATATFAELLDNEAISKHSALLKETVNSITNPQVRNRKSVGGSIASNDPTEDIWAAVLALGAVIRIESASGTRSVAATDFFADNNQTILGEADIVSAIEIPFQSSDSRSAYVQQSDIANGRTIVGVGVIVKNKSDGVIDSCQVAVVGATALPIRLVEVEQTLKGNQVSEKNIAAAWKDTCSSLHFREDFAASGEYRAHLTGIFLQRALMASCGHAA